VTVCTSARCCATLFHSLSLAGKGTNWAKGRAKVQRLQKCVGPEAILAEAAQVIGGEGGQEEIADGFQVVV
jgi:hypothetical protein